MTSPRGYVPFKKTSLVFLCFAVYVKKNHDEDNVTVAALLNCVYLIIKITLTTKIEPMKELHKSQQVYV
ncbi:hypothetical protein RJT34_15721 [Clitoria ternatea]|uniref:Uncharacterized protein n=1 Tax=Clitoria ternatea TaxID=43366 RepID=A0AAN9PC87_CLITE